MTPARRPAEEPVTLLLQESRAGNRDAAESLARIVYRDLCRLAHRKLNGFSEETMDTLGLVGEAYIRIIERGRYELNDRKHFFAVAAQVMRQVLCDSARRRLSEKRGGALNRVDLDEELSEEVAEAGWLLELDDALQKLGGENETWARLVELKYFVGLNEPDIAEALGMSLRQMQREWSCAKAWLKHQMTAPRTRQP